MADSKVFDHPYTMIDEDLNLTLSPHEIWGTSACCDILYDYFMSFFARLKLVDLELVKLVPTSINVCTKEATISKRLDRFPVSRDLLSCPLMFKS
jgi:hypothetical protein